MAFVAPFHNPMSITSRSRAFCPRTRRYTKKARCCVSANIHPESKIEVDDLTNEQKDNGTQRPLFCQRCAAPMEKRRPPGDERTRSVCTKCNNVAYENPKVVVGCVPISKDKKRVLLAKRAIPPIGTWTFPAGFLELGEKTEVGAAREAWEETRANIDMQPVTLLALYNILPAYQIQLLYRCTLLNEDTVAPGCETQEVRMFEWKDIPWDELAFPTVRWGLEYSIETLDQEYTIPQLKTR